MKFEQKGDSLMGKEKLRVVNGTDMSDRLFTEEDISLALDYEFNRRPLDGFEAKRAKKEHDKLDILFDYVQNTPLY